MKEVPMTVKLNQRAYEHAKSLIKGDRYVIDNRNRWSEHQPTTEAENKFIREHGLSEYAQWHLGLDDAHPPTSKEHYKFPYGDFTRVHRCAVLAAEARAGQYKYEDLELAAAHLHGMLEGIA
jgi:hypothetical protein